MRTAELLVKLQKYKATVQILETVIEEDDEIIDAWYLLALCFYKRKKWMNALDCCKNIKKVISENNLRVDQEFESATMEIYVATKLKIDMEQESEPAIGMYDDDSGFSTVSEDDLSSDSDIEMMDF
jgi:tetratricopeptide (TPR) repeat protein